MLFHITEFTVIYGVCTGRITELQSWLQHFTLPLPFLSPHDKCTWIWEAALSFNYNILILSLAAEAETAFKVSAKFWPLKIQQ